jgi:hypothetical protein
MALTFRELAQTPTDRLEALLSASQGPATESLIGFEWRGCNVGPLPRRLGLQKFIKGFFRDGGGAGGYNIPVAQNGLDAPWLHQPSAEAPKRYAFYTVTPVDPHAADGRYPAALLLNYGAGRPSAGTPLVARWLRDYVVAMDPANPDLLLGKAYFALGPWRLPSNFFVLERLRATEWRSDKAPTR